jgi:hypothetical protein
MSGARQERSRRCAAPLRLALVWGVAATVLGVVAVVLFLWTGLSTDSGMECVAPFDGTALACDLYTAWAPVLTVAGVLGAAAALAAVVGVATGRR